MSPISFYSKPLGQRSAGKPPAALDVAGAGDVPSGNAPVLDPTCERPKVRFLRSTLLVLGFQSKADANRFRADLNDRLAKFALQLHPKKTKLIRFGRFAMQDSRRFDGVKASTFDFLGFTHYCTVTRTSGRFMVGRKTIKKRMISTLKDIKLALRRRLHRPIAETGQWLQRVLTGHQNYFGVPCNYNSVQFFFRRVGWYWFRSLRRRSQRHRMTTARFLRIMGRYFPPVRVIHPYPAVRFDAKTQGRSPVR